MKNLSDFRIVYDITKFITKKTNSYYCSDHYNHESLRFVYRGEDSCIRRKRIEALTCLQIYWISQVERQHCMGDQVRSLC